MDIKQIAALLGGGQKQAISKEQAAILAALLGGQSVPGRPDGHSPPVGMRVDYGAPSDTRSPRSPGLLPQDFIIDNSPEVLGPLPSDGDIGGYWDAGRQGNNSGTSFIATEDGQIMPMASQPAGFNSGGHGVPVVPRVFPPAMGNPVDMMNGNGFGPEALGTDTGVTPVVGQRIDHYMGPSDTRMASSPGMLPTGGPEAPGTFGGYDDGLRPTPYTADDPMAGAARDFNRDPRKGGAVDGQVRKQSPLRQRQDAERAAQLAPLRQSYGSFVNEFPPVMLPALSGLPINDRQAAEMLSGMTPEERQQFYSAAAYNLREYGGETATPLSGELRSWQSMGEQERADALERAASFHGFRPPAEQMPADPSMMDAQMKAGPGSVNKQDRTRMQQEIRPLSPDEGRAVGAPSTGSGEVIVQDPNSPVGMSAAIIPGSAAEREMLAEQERNQTSQLYDDVYGAAVFDNIDRARQLAEDTWFTNGGIGGFLSRVGGTNANDMRNLITPILSAIGIDRLQSMREASATGASGFGSLQAAELDLLVNGLYSLEQTQREDQFLDNLNRVEQSLAILQYGPPPEGVTRTQWRDYHRARRQAEQQGMPPPPTPGSGAAGGQRATHRFNPATGQIEAIQ
jgi:hypothetical protein